MSCNDGADGGAALLLFTETGDTQTQTQTQQVALHTHTHTQTVQRHYMELKNLQILGPVRCLRHYH